jgi:putative DNA methylase
MDAKEKIIIPDKAVIESDPPVVFASRLALREGNRKKPIYQMHKWWARRLGSVFRSLLLAAITPENDSQMFKNGFFYQRHDLSGLQVLDPFVGGGTSLIEAAKCGANVIGID